MSELALDFPNSHKYEKEKADPWAEVAAQEFIKASPDEQKVIAAKESYKTIAEEFCDDEEHDLTSGKAEISRPAVAERSEEVGEAYTNLTETQIALIENTDTKIDTPQRKEAVEFANSLSLDDLATPIAGDVIKTFHAITALHRAEVEGKRDKDAEKELKKLGYNPSGDQDLVFGIILQQAKAITYNVPTKETRIDEKLGYKRAADAKELELLLAEPKIGKKRRRALRKAGFKKLPESWNDEAVSTNSIAKMCLIAREYEQ